jgi:hypothetical protein
VSLINNKVNIIHVEYYVINKLEKWNELFFIISSEEGIKGHYISKLTLFFLFILKFNLK